MTSLRAWFLGRTRREQQLLLAMIALFAMVLVWASIVLPVTDRLASARARYADALTRVADTQSRLTTLHGLRARHGAPLGPLDAEVRTRAEAAGLALSQVTPDGPGKVHIALQSVSTRQLFGWIAGLEDAGMIVDDLAVADGGTGTGTVSVQLSLRARP